MADKRNHTKQGYNYGVLSKFALFATSHKTPRVKSESQIVKDYLPQNPIMTKEKSMNPQQQPPPQWGIMQPLTLVKGSLDVFPVCDFPPVIEQYVMSVADTTQTAHDMASVVALGVLAVCNQRKYVVENNYIEPLSLYTVLIAEPGERKSAVVHHFTKVLQEYQHQENKNRKEEINRYHIKKEILETDLKNLKEIKKKPEDIEQQLLSKTRELQDLTEVKPLRLFCDDCSPEALVGLLQKNDGIMSVISAEGGIFDIMSGRYNAKPNLDVFLKGHTGEEIIVDRKGSGNITVENPSLSFVLAIQPEILHDIMENSVMSGRGLLARFLYSNPFSAIGSRCYNSPPISLEIETAYKNLIFSLLALPVPEKPVILTLSEGAKAVMEDYFNKIEIALPKENILKNWLAKHIGSIHRIAGNLHLASEEKSSTQISEKTVASAIAMGKYFGSHTRYCFASSVGEGEISKAKEVLDIIYKISQNQVVTRREVFRKGGGRGLKKMEELCPYLDLLEEYGYIKQVHAPLLQTVTKPSDIIYIHPNYKL